jgi:hypothetical protein
MVFAREPLPCLDLEVDGQEIPTLVTAKLFGLQFDAAATATAMVTHRAGVFASQFGVAVGGSRASCAQAAHSLLNFVYLHKVVAEAAGLYGCGLWGVFMCTPTLQALYAFDDLLSAAGRAFCGVISGCPRTHLPGALSMNWVSVLLCTRMCCPLLSCTTRWCTAARCTRPSLSMMVLCAPQRCATGRTICMLCCHLFTPRGRWRARMLAAELEVLPFGEVRECLA